ncbi:MAG: M6 family metalloprotease domain-containing protein [Planctomycetes bacterium]|nr:M6 family metalloprotease domain-containing protein [Planctomycetota bacterium]
MKRLLLAALMLPVGCSGPAPVKAPPALPEFRTVDQALTTQIKKGSETPVGQSGYLGVTVVTESRGRLQVLDVASDSPAAKAGLLAGDVLPEFGDEEQLRERIHGSSPGDEIKLTVERQGSTTEISAKLGALSRPLKVAERRVVMGVQMGEAAEGGGAPITRITSGSGAEKAGLKSGDVLLKIDGSPITAGSQVSDRLSEKKAGDVITVVYQRGGKTDEVKVTLGTDPAQEERGAGFFRGGSYWKKDVYRLAVIPIEYPDLKHNPKIEARHWEEALFSLNVYSKKNSVTGQPVYGSLNDYYREQSCGAFRVEGKVFDWVEVGKKRSEYSPGTSQNEKTAFISEALEKIGARDGKDSLKDFDGLFLLYAGDRVNTNRGGLYWPHRANANVQGKRWSYFIVPEGGATMTSISVIAHEFGHMLGLPDLYARPENPGSEGLGRWCAMSQQNENGKPQHFGPWCKEQLGWLKPVVIDPTVKQRLLLSPIEGSTKECYKVLVRPDGSEYFLLENRRKQGFDQDLPSEGLLIWRVVRNRPMLEEAHGVDGPAGPNVYLREVPYPSKANDAFTPFTTPSSRSQLCGGLPVHLSTIRRLPDGRISFALGYEYE